MYDEAELSCSAQLPTTEALQVVHLTTLREAVCSPCGAVGRPYSYRNVIFGSTAAARRAGR
jgi:hypothetical protein